MTAELSWSEVAAWRVRRHHLDARRPAGDLVAVVERLAGLHAQLMSSAELTAWARIEGLEPGAVARALWEKRSLVKLWAMRGTLHLLPAEELGLWLAALTAHRWYMNASRLRAFGVTEADVDAIVAAVGKALDGAALTRTELAERVAEITGSAALGGQLRESWGSMLKPAAFQGQLCFAPGEGSTVRFTRPASWLGADPPRPPAEDALRAVARRFLAVHAPATREDFARWWATTPAKGGKLLRSLGDEVATVSVEGTPAFMLAEHVAEAAGAAPARSVRLLPAFDQYIVGATLHADRLLPGPLRDRVYRPQGWLTSVLLVDGRMDGVWRHERKGSRVTVVIEPFAKLPRTVRAAAEDEAQRLAEFAGGELELSWTS